MPLKSLTYNLTSTKINKLFQNKALLVVLKLSAIAFLAILMYLQLAGRDDLSFAALGRLLADQITWYNLPILLLVLVLMPVNWLLETKKWLSLLNNIETIRFDAAVKAVLAGVTFSMFTPNRIGEYGGRALLVSPSKRFMAVFANMVGSFSQWIVLIIGGWWALLGAFTLQIFPVTVVAWISLIAFGLLLHCLLFGLYYNLPWLIKQCIKFKFTNKWATRLHNSIFKNYTNKELNAAFLYSFLRYSTYTAQYVLLLCFFGFDASIVSMTLAIMVIYLLQTGIPLPPSTGLLARGNIALFIFGFIAVSPNASSILAATFSLWLINVVFPALAGAALLAKRGWEYPAAIKDSNTIATQTTV